MKWLIFRVLRNTDYNKRQGESHAIIRHDTTPFNTFGEATQFVAEECLRTEYCLDDFRILAEN